MSRGWPIIMDPANLRALKSVEWHSQKFALCKGNCDTNPACIGVNPVQICNFDSTANACAVYHHCLLRQAEMMEAYNFHINTFHHNAFIKYE
jgi:hypothetical protein